MNAIRDVLTPTLRPLGKARSSILSVLDLGSSKISCVIARAFPKTRLVPGDYSHDLRILGVGYARSAGVKGGVVTDLDAAEYAIRQVVDMAERQAGLSVHEVIVSVVAGRLNSETIRAEIDLKGSQVTRHDIGRAMQAVNHHRVAPGKAVLHTLPIGFSLNGTGGVEQPVGMMADKLGVDMHLVTIDDQGLRNLENAIHRCHLDVQAIVSTPFASALATLSQDEKEIGTACLDMGGGTSKIAVFAKGHMVHNDSIPIGSHHITLDIARGLSISLHDAERVKTLYASAHLGAVLDKEPINSISLLDQNGADLHVTRGHVAAIVQPRLAQILSQIRDRLEAVGLMDVIGGRFVLTGGGCELQGLEETARAYLGQAVRLGVPQYVQHLPAAVSRSAFATPIGLLNYAILRSTEFTPKKTVLSRGPLARMRRFLGAA